MHGWNFSGLKYVVHISTVKLKQRKDATRQLHFTIFCGFFFSSSHPFFFSSLLLLLIQSYTEGHHSTHGDTEFIHQTPMNRLFAQQWPCWNGIWGRFPNFLLGLHNYRKKDGHLDSDTYSILFLQRL